MLGEQIGTKINEAFYVLEEVISLHSAFIAELKQIIKTSHRSTDVKKVSDKVIGEINIEIDHYNEMINTVIYGVRVQEEGFAYEDICLALEKCIINNIRDEMIMNESFFSSSVKKIQKNLSMDNLAKMKESIYLSANEGFNTDVIKALMVA